MSEILQQLPIEHISFSSMRMFCANPYQFKKNYILNIWEYKSSVAACVGKAFHKFTEVFYKTYDVDESTKAAYQLINSMKDSDIEYGKTGSREGMIKETRQAIDFFFNNRPDVGTVFGTEISVTAHFEHEGIASPIPIKAKTDLVSDLNNELTIWDFKVVTSHSNPDDEQPDYIMQAMFNYFTIKAKFDREPVRAIFVEVKKSLNKTGGSQLQFYEINYSDHPEYFKYFLNMYAGLVRALANPDFLFLPNFSDLYSGKESWKDFTSELLDFEMPKQITHKSVLVKNVENQFVESVTHSVKGDNLSDAEMIISKMLEFGVSIEHVATHTGASVTLYTYKPSRGVSMKRISSFEADVALALGAKSVRIQAPIVGTKLVGFEVSNDVQQKIVWTESVLHESTLILPMGADVYNNIYYLDLAKAPHLLVAGTTGSGKSVGLNVFITTLLKQNSASELQMILIDPKETEFVAYEGDPHLMAEVITDAEKANGVLTWLGIEMNSRYKTLRESQSRNIDEYRTKGGTMVSLVVVIDELADLMLSEFRNDIESNIVRIAQKARACGIHLIIATQRPSVDVVTGVLKANLPTRLTYAVASRVDSQVILDQAGAENLIGNGDSLLMNPKERNLIRLQGLYL